VGIYAVIWATWEVSKWVTRRTLPRRGSTRCRAQLTYRQSKIQRRRARCPHAEAASVPLRKGSRFGAIGRLLAASAQDLYHHLLDKRLTAFPDLDPDPATAPRVTRAACRASHRDRRPGRGARRCRGDVVAPMAAADERAARPGRHQGGGRDPDCEVAVGEGDRRHAGELPVPRPPAHRAHPRRAVRCSPEGHDGPVRPVLGEGHVDLSALHEERQEEFAAGLDVAVRKARAEREVAMASRTAWAAACPGRP